MKRRMTFLLGCIAAALCVPVGFAIAQSAMTAPEAPATEIPVTHDDPDPTTDPGQQMAALNKAQAEGDTAAEAEAVAGIREEIMSRVHDE